MSEPSTERFRPIHAVLAGLILLVLCDTLAVGLKRRLLFDEWDHEISVRLHQHGLGDPRLVAAMRAESSLSEGWSIVAEGVCGLLIFAAGRRWRWCAIWGLAIAGVAINELVKVQIGRLRPEFDDPFIKLTSHSFPSSHAAGS